MKHTIPMLIALLMLTIPLAGCLENGAEGPQGPSGPQGPPGADGADGADGMDGVNGTDGQDGADGMDGVNGTDGNNGADGAVGATGPQGPIGPQGLPGSPSAAIRLALTTAQTDIVAQWNGINFNANPTYSQGNIWTVTASGSSSFGTYVKTSVNIEAYITYGFTIDANDQNTDNVWVKIQTSDNATTWIDVPYSKIIASTSSASPDYYGSSGSCMISLAANTYVRAVVYSTDYAIDLEAGTNGDTYLSIQDMLGGAAGADGQDGADGAVGATGPQGPAGADGANGINGTSNMPINSIQDTDADIDVYSDSQIRIWFIDSGTPSDDDEYGIEIFTHSSSGQVYAFQTITDATAGTPYRASLDLNSPSNQTLNYGIGPDHVVTLQLWMPENTSWGYYDITIIKSNSGYSNTPILCSVVHSTI